MTNDCYHIYNRGAHKAPIFGDGSDYWRFLHLLYIGNSAKPIRLSEIAPQEVFSKERVETLVDIIAYCLMPNHFHIFAKERKEHGITEFMRKLCTGYSMYYNFKYHHSGTIFQGKYKSKPVETEEYFRYLIQYIHLNPFGIEEPDLLKEARKEYLDEAMSFSKRYEYSSFKDYLGEDRSQKVILASVRSDLTNFDLSLHLS